jgi:hypothetical protein
MNPIKRIIEIILEYINFILVKATHKGIIEKIIHIIRIEDSAPSLFIKGINNIHPTAAPVRSKKYILLIYLDSNEIIIAIIYEIKKNGIIRIRYIKPR